ncbi:hypothetical protein EDM22_13050 [Agromyces tardus]|uniref:Uncharacterized protein n=1 Tax=Agromyces tardus TaxID=2583849 RepID=A0A3M8A7D3_9MICO|nr:hypothetical protein EDM22_13050 [Agromyces tardus]
MRPRHPVPSARRAGSRRARPRGRARRRRVRVRRMSRMRPCRGSSSCPPWCQRSKRPIPRPG